MKTFDWNIFTIPSKTGVHTNGSPCQDKVCIKENDWRLVITLSDGVGSLLYSQVAAQVVTTTAAELLCDYPFDTAPGKDHLVDQLVDTCRAAVAAEAKNQGLPLSGMDCTLLFAVIFKTEDCCIIGQLGDGAICFIRADGAEKCNAGADAKSGANMTKTIFSGSAQQHFSFHATRLASMVGILLTSDGLQNELYSVVGNVKSNLQWYFNTVAGQPLEESREKIAARWEHLAAASPAEFSDDMSLVIIYKPNTTVSLPQDANWLCSCGCRNSLESSRCGVCNMDFLKLYQGCPYREHGGKKGFFSYLNSNPDEEQAWLQKSIPVVVAMAADQGVSTLDSYTLEPTPEEAESAAPPHDPVQEQTIATDEEKKELTAKRLEVEVETEACQIKKHFTFKGMFRFDRIGQFLRAGVSKIVRAVKDKDSRNK